MQCVNPQVALLSNYEVFTLLKAKHQDQRKTHNAAVRKAHADGRPAPKIGTEIERQVFSYMTKVNDLPRHWTDDDFTSFLERIARFGLLKGEQLMLLNNRPSSMTGLFTCIEEIDERFTHEQQEEMLAIIKETLPIPPAQPADLVLDGEEQAAPSTDAMDLS
ncbi:RNA polymerase Rpb4-domain-containing protein [Catenaria anguillulae PL171]|uniref:DNA-directed RNA polymerase III subunit RPC9 n=1 Tax=Catenaria anguillulae PL171 TaxID=765915 RepID=A0A1Y2HVH0_9FUNG|nr:RNA polymerase Rpb4-domain-containing protein [Catenaria anguillulae PL171]